MPEGTRLPVTHVRLELRPHAALQFSAMAAIDWRGALGNVLPMEVFRPAWPDGPSGWRTAPAPFALRTHSLNGLTIAARQPLVAELEVFADGFVPVLRAALEELGGTGIGRNPDHPRERVRFDVMSLVADKTALDWGLDASDGEQEIALRFVTPVEFKGEAIDHPPALRTLLLRLHDRASALTRFYAGAEPPWLASAIADLSEPAVLLAAEGQAVEQTRRSSRTGESHGLRGWQGVARYSHVRSALLPLLRAGTCLGAGRHTAWGMGYWEGLPPRKADLQSD